MPGTLPLARAWTAAPLLLEACASAVGRDAGSLLVVRFAIGGVEIGARPLRAVEEFERIRTILAHPVTLVMTVTVMSDARRLHLLEATPGPVPPYAAHPVGGSSRVPATPGGVAIRAWGYPPDADRSHGALGVLQVRARDHLERVAGRPVTDAPTLAVDALLRSAASPTSS